MIILNWLMFNTFLCIYIKVLKKREINLSYLYWVILVRNKITILVWIFLWLFFQVQVFVIIHPMFLDLQNKSSWTEVKHSYNMKLSRWCWDDYVTCKRLSFTLLYNLRHYLVWKIIRKVKFDTTLVRCFISASVIFVSRVLLFIRFTFILQVCNFI